MSLILCRILAMPILATHPFGKVIWQLNTCLTEPQCMPLSLLGVILHQCPKVAEKKSSEEVFKCFLEAYQTRVRTGFDHFNSTMLKTMGLTQKSGPLVSGSDETAIDQVFDWIKKQPGTACVLTILPQNVGKGAAFHAITVTYDELRTKGKGFGLQETVYPNGFPCQSILRYSRHFSDFESFKTSLSTFIQNLLEYSPGFIQAISIKETRSTVFFLPKFF